MALWSTTEQSAQRALQNWGVEAPSVQIVPPDRGPVQDSTLTWDDEGAVVVDAVMGRIPASAQGSEVDSRGGQLRYPAEAAMVLTAIAPARFSRWRGGHLPDDPRLRRVLWELDQVRVDALLGAQDPSLRLVLHAASAWVGRAPYVGSDDAVARQLLTHLCPRADSLTLPVTATDPVKETLVEYLGPEAMREFIDLWRELLACPDHRSLVVGRAVRWLDALDRHLPAHANLTGTPRELDRLAHTAATHLDDLESDARRHLAALREEWTQHSPQTLQGANTDLHQGVGGAGTGLPTDHGIYHRPATAEEVENRENMRAALAVAKRRRLRLVDTPSRTPVGRADTRELVQWAAQRHYGRPIVAAPWRRAVPELSEEPHITVAAVFDASASMANWLRTASPLMWAIAGAAHDLGGVASAWGFGGGAFEVIRAGSAPHLVPELHARQSGSTGYAEAIVAAANATQLRSRSGARMLLVLTDGRLPGVDEQRRLQESVTSLVDSGVSVLWALTGEMGPAVVPDRATVVTGITPTRFATVVRAALLDEVAAAR